MRRPVGVPVSRLLGAISQAVLRRQGFAQAHILRHWAEIVGAEIAGMAAPETLRFSRGAEDGGVLTIRVDGPVAVEIQHLEPQILERINAYYGYRAVGRLKLVQGPLPLPPRQAPPPRPLSREEQQKLADEVERISDPGVRAALMRFGRSMLSAQRR